MHEMDDIAREFIDETTENLNQADSDMVALESNPEDRELLSRIFRTMHTIKGACGFLGYVDLGALAHNAESLLGLLRDGEISVTEDIVTAILDTLDNIRSFIADIEAECDNKFEIDQELIATLQRLAHDSDRMPDAAADLPADGERSAAPSEAAPSATTAEATEQPAAAGRAAAPSDAEAEAEADAEAEATADSQQADTGVRGSTANTLRIRVELIDQLMNQVGELVLARNRLALFSTESADVDFVDSIQSLAHVTDALQESVMKTRMQPIGVAWRGIPRVVRDLANDCGKKVLVRLQGSDTELDKSVVEAIKDPIIHLVRNVVDHGIESPADRRALGKPETGNLLLHAFHEGGEVILEISDDGRGFDVEKLRERAIGNGTVTREQAARLSDHELHNLAFQPGVSTAAQVSAVSGRGVGMDVVKTNVESLGGTVDVYSTKGQGARTTIKIPLTLAIVPAITVLCGGEQYAIPQIYLQEFARLDGQQGSARIEYVQGAPVCRLRDQLFPLVFLDEVLGLRSDSEKPDEQIQNGQLVVLHVGGSWFGLAVDEIGSPEEIVVKPLPTMLRGIPVLSGAAVIGDGHVALILDVVGLAQQCRIATESRELAVDDQMSTEHVEESSESHVLVEVATDYRAAIPITAIERLESIESSRVENSLEGPVFQQGAEVVPIFNLAELLGIHAEYGGADESIRLIVCRHDGELVALRVARIVDVASRLNIVRENKQHGAALGTGVVNEHVTDVVDPRRLLSARATRQEVD